LLYFFNAAAINPKTISAIFSRRVPVRSKAEKRRCSHPAASFANAACGPAHGGLSLSIKGLGASGMQQSHVAVLDKGITLACARRLVLLHA